MKRSCAQKSPTLGFCWNSVVTSFEFLILIEQGASHFHFVPGPTRYIAGPAYIYTILFNPHNNLISLSQMKKLRYREIK